VQFIPAISDVAIKRAPGSSRSFYSASLAQFLAADPKAIIGQLSSKHVAFHAAAEAEQIRAWEREIELLRAALAEVGEAARNWIILIEVPLLRLGKRLDVVLLAPGVVALIEFKIGATRYDSADKAQTEGYAHSLRDFHEVSQRRLVIPILCAEKAPDRPIRLAAADGVADLVFTNASTLARALKALELHIDPNAAELDPIGFDLSPYRPTPTIIEAAQALYAGHEIADIGRGDAGDAELQAAASALQAIAARAETERTHTVCFVTGAPGAGKTLLGLDLALKSQSGTRPGALLSGNRPLVHVLTEALATDRAARTGESKAAAKYHADAAIQNLLGYLKEHTDGPPPPENVIIFDEAQRAWDAEVGQQLMGRRNSEPEIILGILRRLQWSCLVCLVGYGQEINRGEGGLRLWGEALGREAASGNRWRIFAATPAIEGGPDVTGDGLIGGLGEADVEIFPEPKLHLANSMRAYRNPLHGKWVEAVLNGDADAARRTAGELTDPPALATRDLDAAKGWLRQRRRGGRSVGLLTSSGAVRLVGDGIPPAPRSNELSAIGHWFLKPFTDFRSGGALEIPMSEYGCQGLELDFVGLCWGGDLVWRSDCWLPRKMSAPRWQVLRDDEKRRFRLNAYRVLLTRSRAGTVIFIPRGSGDDPTRSPAELDETAKALLAFGCASLA
jgi:Uncharacterized conserved protein (DUF2075)